MKKGLFLVAVWSLISSLTPQVYAQQEPTGDLAKLQGKWAAYVQYPTGKMKVVIDFQGDQVFTTMGDDPDSKPDTQQQVKIDEKAKPRTMDFVNGKKLGAEPGSAAAQLGVPDIMGIYELDGDTLRVASIPLSSKRPVSLKPAKGIFVATYTRGTTPSESADAAAPKSNAAATKGAKVPLKGDLALLQGTWVLQSGTFNASGKETLTIQGDSLVSTAKLPRGEVRYSSRIKLDESTSPRSIDFVNPMVGTRRLGNAAGIYEIDADTLRIHKSGENKGRALVFEDGAQQGSVSVWTRPTSAGNMATAKRAPAPAPSAPAPPARQPGPVTFRGAKILKVMNYQMLVEVDGKQIKLGSITRATKAFDAQGKPIADGQATRLIWEGNVVDVTIEDPQFGTEVASLREVRLVEGKVGEQNPATGLVPK
jgi:uncharacterized protein (TIGR03067 family)